MSRLISGRAVALVATNLACDSTSVSDLEPQDPAPGEAVDQSGWDDPPGTGLVFIVDDLAIEDAPDTALRGFALANEQVKKSIVDGETMILVEIAGFDGLEPEEDITVKLYTGLDHEDPIFPVNNFSPPYDGADCCQFRIWGGSLLEGQARSRAEAVVRNGSIQLTGPASFHTTLPWGVPPLPIARLEEAFLSAELTSTNTLENGHARGAVPIETLALLSHGCRLLLGELCTSTDRDASLLDGLSAFLQPDTDLDEDGLEQILQGPNGRVERCIDGELDGGDALPPIDPEAPWSCALHPEAKDGYSTAVRFSAVPALVTSIVD